MQEREKEEHQRKLFSRRLECLHIQGGVFYLVTQMGQPDDSLQKRLDAALDALHGMLDQYCATGVQTESGEVFYDHMFMSAGEDACGVLHDEGRITGDQYT